MTSTLLRVADSFAVAIRTHDHVAALLVSTAPLRRVLVPRVAGLIGDTDGFDPDDADGISGSSSLEDSFQFIERDDYPPFAPHAPGLISRLLCTPPSNLALATSWGRITLQSTERFESVLQLVQRTPENCPWSLMKITHALDGFDESSRMLPLLNDNRRLPWLRSVAIMAANNKHFVEKVLPPLIEHRCILGELMLDGGDNGSSSSSSDNNSALNIGITGIDFVRLLRRCSGTLTKLNVANMKLPTTADFDAERSSCTTQLRLEALKSLVLVFWTLSDYNAEHPERAEDPRSVEALMSCCCSSSLRHVECSYNGSYGNPNLLAAVLHPSIAGHLESLKAVFATYHEAQDENARGAAAIGECRNLRQLKLYLGITSNRQLPQLKRSVARVVEYGKLEHFSMDFDTLVHEPAAIVSYLSSNGNNNNPGQPQPSPSPSISIALRRVSLVMNYQAYDRADFVALGMLPQLESLKIRDGHITNIVQCDDAANAVAEPWHTVFDSSADSLFPRLDSLVLEDVTIDAISTFMRSLSRHRTLRVLRFKRVSPLSKYKFPNRGQPDGFRLMEENIETTSNSPLPPLCEVLVLNDCFQLRRQLDERAIALKCPRLVSLNILFILQGTPLPPNLVHLQTTATSFPDDDDSALMRFPDLLAAKSSLRTFDFTGISPNAKFFPLSRIAALSQLTQLREISLHECDIEAIGRLTCHNLRKLSLRNCALFEEQQVRQDDDSSAANSSNSTTKQASKRQMLRGLEKLPRLRDLFFNHVANVGDVSCLAESTSLAHVAFLRCGVPAGAIKFLQSRMPQLQDRIELFS